MNDIDKLIRNSQQSLIAAQSAKIMQLEREKAELQAEIQRKKSQLQWSQVTKKREVQA